MLCFRDVTFCAAKCANVECFRNWTTEKQLDADRWWGSLPNTAPIAFSDFSATCPEYQPALSEHKSLPGGLS